MAKPLQSLEKKTIKRNDIKPESFTLQRINSLLANPQLSKSQRMILLNILKGMQAKNTDQEGL